MMPNDVRALADAQELAAAYVGSRDSKTKVHELISRAARKARQNYEFLLAPWESLQIVLRMIRSWVAGRYAVPLGTLLGGIAVLLYFVDPLDLIPDSVPVLGYLDDATVITAFMRMNLSEMSRYRRWEVTNSLPTSRKLR